MIFPCRRDKPAGTERDEKCSIRSHRITRWARKIAAVRAGDCCGPFFVRGSRHVVAKAHGAGMKRLRGERMMSPAIVLEVAVSNVRAAASPGDAHFRAFAAEQEKPFSKSFFSSARSSCIAPRRSSLAQWILHMHDNCRNRINVIADRIPSKNERRRREFFLSFLLIFLRVRPRIP